jgi:hypothetical protein
MREQAHEEEERGRKEREETRKEREEQEAKAAKEAAKETAGGEEDLETVAEGEEGEEEGGEGGQQQQQQQQQQQDMNQLPSGRGPFAHPEVLITSLISCGPFCITHTMHCTTHYTGAHLLWPLFLHRCVREGSWAAGAVVGLQQ